MLGNEIRELSDIELLNRDYYQGRFASKINGETIFNWDESMSSWFEIIIMMKIHNENSSLLGKYIIAIEYSSLGWNSSIDEYFKLSL